jgi:adenosylcobinamide-GDP ribazoletransferase
LRRGAGGDTFYAAERVGRDARCGAEDLNMPPLAYETVAWLRHYTCVPIAALPGESDEAGAQRAAYAAPIAGALLGAAAGLVLLVAALVGAPTFLAAALALLTLLMLTCGRGEQALAGSAEEIGRGGKSAAAPAGTRLLSYGLVAIVLAVLIRVGALDGLAALGPWKAAFALLGAVAVSRAATVAFSLIRPAPVAEGTEPSPDADRTALQWVAVIGAANGILCVLPFLGIGAAIAGLVGAIGAVAILTAFMSRNGEEADKFSAGAELISEIAFLLAVLAFATRA